MELVLIIIAAVAVGTYLGWRAHEAFLIHIITHDPAVLDEMRRIVRDNPITDDTETITLTTSSGATINASGVEMSVEQVGDVVYAYAKTTGKFIAQGNTIEELLSSAHNRFPGQTFFGDLPQEDQKS
jgi:hypothetical protein